MSKPKRHLHRDYNTTFCGRDASHLQMTYEPAEADCAACLKAHQIAEAEKENGEEADE